MRRETVLGLLVVVYAAVSLVAYTDYPRHSNAPPLTDLERRGLHLWRRHNCQVCHQIYGFGGFLGPDLTNRVTDATATDELGPILQEGAGAMPAFHFTAAEREALLAYLRRVSRSGQSQPTPLAARRRVPPAGHLRRLTEAWERQTHGTLSASERRGLETWERFGCGACHRPFAPGRMLAPDLSGRAVDHSPAALQRILAQGRGRMPPFPVDSVLVPDLSAYLTWVSGRRGDLVALNDSLLERERFSWSRLPWFEYR